MDGVIQRGGSGVMQSREKGSGKFGRKVVGQEDSKIEVRDQSSPDPQVIEREKLPTQANRGGTGRGPEVVG